MNIRIESVSCLCGGGRQALNTMGGTQNRSRRVAPIRETVKTARRGGVWLAFKVIVALALSGCALYWIGSKVSRPFSLLHSTNEEVREISAKLQATHGENEGLRRGIAYMDTPEGKAQAGRWSGLVKKGERRLLIPED